MQLFWVRIRYDVNTSALTQSKNTEYRIKEREFKRDDIIVYDIPVSDFPFRIPGTHVGIKTEKPLNPGKELNMEHLDQLDAAVTSTMQEITALLKNDKREDYTSYDAEPLPSEEFSHRQNLQIVNELVKLRKVIRSKTGFKEEWVEVLEHAYQSVDVSGYGYHRKDHADNANAEIALSSGNDDYEPQQRQSCGLPYNQEKELMEQHLLSQQAVGVEEANDEQARDTDDFRHSGIRPEREFDPERPRSPLRYADEQQMQLNRLAQQEESEPPRKRLEIPETDPNDPKFAHIERKYDIYYNGDGSSLDRIDQPEYESAYRQDRIRGEIVHYDRDFESINREAVIGANEVADPRIAGLMAGRVGEEDVSVNAELLEKRIMAQRYAAEALNGDESAYKRLRGLANYGVEGPGDVSELVRQEALDDGADAQNLDFMRESQVERLSPRTRQRVVDELVSRIAGAMYDTAPEVRTERPKTARRVQGETNCRIGGDEELGEYEHVSFQSRPHSAGGPSGAAEYAEEEEGGSEEESGAQAGTITQKMWNPPEPQRSVREIARNDVVFANNGLRRSGARGSVGYSIRLPSILRGFKNRISGNARDVLEVQAQLPNGDVDKGGDDYDKWFASVCDGIFLNLLDEMLSLGIEHVKSQVAAKTSAME